jgi:hypothetical protein
MRIACQAPALAGCPVAHARRGTVGKNHRRRPDIEVESIIAREPIGVREVQVNLERDADRATPVDCSRKANLRQLL